MSAGGNAGRSRGAGADPGSGTAAGPGSRLGGRDRSWAGAGGDAGAVRRRQLVLFSVIAAVLLAAIAAWLGMGGGKAPAPRGGIEAEIAGPDAAEKVWTRRSEARLGGIETQIRELRQEARRLGADNERLRAKLESDAADARSVIDRQAALIDELRRGLSAPAGNGQGNAPGNDPWFRGQPATPSTGGEAQPAIPAPRRMIETFDLDGAPQSSVIDPRTGAELVADAVARPVSTWLPAGAHAEAVVLAGVDASAGVSSQGDPRPVLLRITGPAWTAAPSGSGDGTAMQVDVDGCTVTGVAHGDLSSEKVYVRFRTMTCAGPEPGTVVETEVAGFVAGSGKTGVRGPGREPRGRAGREGVPRRHGLGRRPGHRPGVPAPGGGDRHGGGGRQHVLERHRARRPRRRGVERPDSKVADYMIRRAEQYQPVVQLQAGTKVTLVFLEGARIDGRAPVRTAQKGQ